MNMIFIFNLQRNDRMNRFSPKISALTKAIAALLILSALLPFLFSCDRAGFTGSGKVKVTATLFPQYDFVRQVGGERVEVIKLLPAGADSHSFSPTASDLKLISASDLFFYTGPEMEPWAGSVMKSVSGDSAVRPIDLSEGIGLLKGEDDDEDEHEEHEHVHNADPHIWTSPKNAMAMVGAITEALVSVDPEGEEYYRTRSAAYLAELDALDQKFALIAAASNGKTLVFGGRFAFLYLTEEYGFSHISPFHGCDSEAEPASSALAAVIDRVKAEGTETIFCEEMVFPRVANAIAEETGAKVETLHSCHNVTDEEMNAGVTYVSLMTANADLIASVLN